MKYIYARTSTTDQNVEQQAELLSNAYPESEIHCEQASGTNMERPVLNDLLAVLKEGDTLVIYDMSRLSRNVVDFLVLIKDFDTRDIGLIIHSMGGQSVDTRSPIGKMILTVLASIEEMNVSMMKEKQKIAIDRIHSEDAGKPLEYRRYKGRIASPKTQKACVRAMELIKGGSTKLEASKAVGIGVATLYRHIKAG